MLELDLWKTLLKWVGIIALIVALIGLPVWYFQMETHKAFEQGKLVGRAEASREELERTSELVQTVQKILTEESQNSRKLQMTLQEQRAQTETLRGQLKEANEKNPPSTDCRATEPVTNILRDAANGATQSDRDAVSRSLIDQVPGQTLVPEQRNIKHVRDGGFVSGGG